MFFLASNGYRCIAHDRRGHGRSSQPWNGNDMDTYADDLAELIEALDLRERRDDRPLHRRRRGRALHRPPRHQAGRQGGADGRGAADHAEDRGQSRRPADRGVRRLPQGLPGRPLAVLHGRRLRPVLRLQPARRQGLAGDDRVVLAAGDDVGPQERLRLHQGVLRDGLHRGPEEVRRADADRPRRRRPDRADRRLGAALGEAGQERDPQGLPRRLARPRRHVTRSSSTPTCWRSPRPEQKALGADHPRDDAARRFGRRARRIVAPGPYFRTSSRAPS